MAAVPPEWLPVTLGLCLKNLPPDARPIFLSHLPEGVAALWSSQWQSQFEDHMASLAPTGY